jgi:hypothetical protein
MNPAESNEYIFVFDISAGKPLQTQVLQVPQALDGLAFNPSGKEFYVSGGTDDNVHFYEFNGASWAESGTAVKLGHLFFDAKGNRAGALSLGSVSPGAMGLAVTGDGKRVGHIQSGWRFRGTIRRLFQARGIGRSLLSIFQEAPWSSLTALR